MIILKRDLEESPSIPESKTWILKRIMELYVDEACLKLRKGSISIIHNSEKQLKPDRPSLQNNFLRSSHSIYIARFNITKEVQVQAKEHHDWSFCIL